MMYSKVGFFLFFLLNMINALNNCQCPPHCVCSLNNKVDCRSQSLTAIPEDIPSTTTILDLSDNNLDAIPSRAFQELSSLLTLHLSYNNIQDLANDTFKGLQNLSALQLRGNKLSKLPEDVFRDLMNLRTLQLKKNTLTSLPPVAGMVMLKTLNLAKNNISTLDSFPHLPNLSDLDLSQNSITLLSNDTFWGIPNVTNLFFSNNELIDDSLLAFEELKSLEVLFLDHNQLTKFFAFPSTIVELNLCCNNYLAIPFQAFHQLSVLKNLNLSDNNIESIADEAFTGLHNLSALHLAGNKLSSLPRNIFDDLTNLRELQLNNNNLTTLPRIENLTRLTHINLANNNIADIDDLKHLPELIDLILSHNRIAFLPEDLFQRMPNVTSVRVSYNRLEDGSLSAFTGLSNLQKLYLDHNKLTSFSALNFSRSTDSQSSSLISVPEKLNNYSSLRHLFLGSNQIALTDESFTGLTELTHLNLEGNKMIGLPASVFNGLPSLQYLDLRDNNISSLASSQFLGIDKLRWLFLDHNRLLRPPNTTSLHRLQVLSLSHNFITDIEPNDLRIFSNISTIDLSYNRLHSLPVFFPSMFNTQYYVNLSLHFGGNPVTKIEARAFERLPPKYSLTLALDSMAVAEIDEHALDGLNCTRCYIDLRNNRLSALPAKMCFFCDRRVFFELDKNPWSCDCRLKGCRKWMPENERHLRLTGFTCQYPEAYLNVSVIDVVPQNMTCIPPLIDKPAMNVSANAGDSVELECDVTGWPQPTVYWLTPMHKRISKSADNTSSAESGDLPTMMQDDYLLLPSVAIKNSGSYLCVATNLEGHEIAVRYLEVNENEKLKPNIQQTNKTETEKETELELSTSKTEIELELPINKTETETEQEFILNPLAVIITVSLIGGLTCSMILVAATICIINRYRNAKKIPSNAKDEKKEDSVGHDSIEMIWPTAKETEADDDVETREEISTSHVDAENPQLSVEGVVAAPPNRGKGGDELVYAAATTFGKTPRPKRDVVDPSYNKKETKGQYMNIDAIINVKDKAK
ncbi:chondroadherin-like protein [Ptychodera flava]|uniref:chondroadherin-like protein n=1 Tax=Ptychodera flava TaxID=63121 RepID=UPI00396A554E